MNQKEEQIKNERTFEATRNNLMGMTGKLGIICKHLGQPIQKEGSGLYDTRELEDAWLLDDGADDIPTMDAEEISYTIGYVFDGLRLGMHIEIKYLEDRKELNCYYKGFEVYREVSGELEAYAPNPEWEQMIDLLFRRAKDAEKRHMKQEHAAIREEAGRRHTEFLEHLKTRWGFK